MLNNSFLLIEDKRVIGTFFTKDEAVAAMEAEHKKDLFAMIAKRRLLNLFISGKYKLKEYIVVEVKSVKTVNSDDSIGGIF